MEQPASSLLCPSCQQENEPSAVTCRACHGSLLVSLAVTRPVPPEPAQVIASLLAGGNRALEDRLEARLLRGRGVLLKELSTADARWCQEQAARLGVVLEVRRWRVVSSPRRAAPTPWTSRPITGAVVVVLLGIALVSVHYLYRIITAPPPDAGISWRSATVKPGRIVPPGAVQPDRGRPGAPISDETLPLEAIDAAKQAVARVSAKDSIGTGFFVGRDGLLVTNYHVIAGGGPITVITADQQRAEAQLLRPAPAWDLALLKVPLIPPGMLELADGLQSQPHDLSHVIGTADGQSGSARDGRVSKTMVIMDAVVMLELDVAAAHGNSGSPVLDSSGRVVGILNAIRSDTDRTSYAIVSNYLFDGPDALLRGQAPVFAMSQGFLDMQLRALANVGDRFLPHGGISASHAFVTSTGQLAVLAEAYASSIELDGQEVDVDLWVRRKNGSEILIRPIRAASSGSSAEGVQPAENRAVYLSLQLSPREYQQVQEAGEVWVEVVCRALKLREYLSLKV
jgi:S1-C subfamily serine protease